MRVSNTIIYVENIPVDDSESVLTTELSHFNVASNTITIFSYIHINCLYTHFKHVFMYIHIYI